MRNENIFMSRKKQYGEHLSKPANRHRPRALVVSRKRGVGPNGERYTR